MRVFSLTQSVHYFIASKGLPPGMLIDMTVGTGADTFFLNSTFQDRPILAIDIQQEALNRAQKKVNDHQKSIHWRLGCHTQVNLWLDELGFSKPSVALAMYNLGYLPGSDKSIITTPSTTVASLRALFPCIVVSGMISLMVYTGHTGGLEEQQAIEKLLQTLPICSWNIWEMSRKFNTPLAPAPYWLMVQKIA